MTKILLVEDDKSLREIYGVRLLAEGYDIISAGDGEEALAMAIKDRPILIISDVMMPKISGFDMLDILRSTTETRDVKVIMMTALSSEDQRARGEQLGADRYLVKSQVGIEDVVRTVHEVLGDAPTTSQAPTFSSTPMPSQNTAPSMAPNPRPATLTAPERPQPASIAQQQQQQQQSSPAVAQPSPAPEPYSPPAYQAQVPVSAPTATPPSGLPQPTAPFSTNRPSGMGLADRVINPLPREVSSGPDVSELMSRELSDASDNQTRTTIGVSNTPPPAQAPQPAAPFAQTPPSFAPSTAMPTPPTPPPAPLVQPNSTPPNTTSSNELSFEETPRTDSAPVYNPAPSPNPFINNSQQ